jgi:hypothetical protein
MKNHVLFARVIEPESVPPRGLKIAQPLGRRAEPSDPTLTFENLLRFE